MNTREMENEIKNIYNSMGENYIAKAEKNWKNKNNIDAFLTMLTGSSILDIGCGTGDVLKYCFDKGYNVTGVDISEEMLKISKKRCSSASLHNLSVYDISKLTETFDGIIVTYVFVHIPKSEIENVIVNIKQRLKQKGKVLLLFTNTENPNKYMVNYSLQEISTLLKQSNFKIISTEEEFGDTNTVKIIAENN